MDSREQKRLEERGAIVDLGSGRRGVKVSVQYPQRFTARSRTERRSALRHAFEDVVSDVHDAGGRVDLNSVSLSGQTVEAVLPLDAFDEVVERMRGHGFRTDVLEQRQVVAP